MAAASSTDGHASPAPAPPSLPSREGSSIASAVVPMPGLASCANWQRAPNAHMPCCTHMLHIILLLSIGGVWRPLRMRADGACCREPGTSAEPGGAPTISPPPESFPGGGAAAHEPSAPPAACGQGAIDSIGGLPLRSTSAGPPLAIEAGGGGWRRGCATTLGVGLRALGLQITKVMSPASPGWIHAASRWQFPRCRAKTWRARVGWLRLVSILSAKERER